MAIHCSFISNTTDNSTKIFWELDKITAISELITYLLTPWRRVLLEKLTGLQLVKKFPAFHGARRFITAFTSVCHLSLSWASPIQSIYPHPTPWRSILILSTHLCLGLPQWSPSLRFPQQDPIHPPLLTHTCHMPSSELIMNCNEPHFHLCQII